MNQSESTAQGREDVLRKIESRLKHDDICTEFESNWTFESVDRISELVGFEDETQRSELACELIAIDLEMRQARGEQVQVVFYQEQLPDFHAEVSAAFELSTARDDAAGDHDTGSIPTKIGDYRIIKLIGRGGSGVVYEAIQESLDRRVAIKMLNNPGVTSQLARFQLETRLVAKLHHTNIIEIFGSGVHEGTPYYAMRLIEGKTLRQIIRDTRQSSRPTGDSKDIRLGISNQKLVATIGLQVARAIDHAHQNGILHRDIKPGNLLMDQEGETWVGDFGVARLLDHDSPNTIMGSVIGTMRYLPPEAFDGQWQVQSDIYSLGTTLYELLALAPAFSADDHRQLVRQITQQHRCKPLRQIDDSISRDLETIVSKAMSFEPEKRFSSAEELADELHRYLRGDPIVSRPIPVAERVWRWAKRKPSLAALIALTFAVAFIGLPIVMSFWLRESRALAVAERERTHAIEMKNAADLSRLESQASQYSNGVLLAQSYLEDSRISDVERTLDELKSNNLVKAVNSAADDPWEIRYLKRACDTAALTLRSDPQLSTWHVALSPDEQQLATVQNGHPSSHERGEVIIWNLGTGERELTLRDHGSRVFGCAYDSSGKRLATIGMNYPPAETGIRGTLCVWNTSTGERIHQVDLSGEFDHRVLGVYGQPILPGVAFSKDDTNLITWPVPIELFDAQSLESVWKIDGRHAAQLPSGQLIAYDGNRVDLRDFDTGKSVKKIEHQYGNCGPFSFDGQRMICRTNGGAKIWNSTESLNSSENLMWPDVSWAKVLPGTSKIVYGGGNGQLNICSFDPSPLDDSEILLGHRASVTSGVFSRDRSMLITGSIDGTSKVWDLTSKRSVNIKYRHDHVAALCFDTDSDEVLFATRNHTGGRWDYNAGISDSSEAGLAGQRIDSTYMAHWPRNDFSFSSTGKFLAAPAAERTHPDSILGYAQHGLVNVWSTSDWKLLHTIESQLDEIHATEWSPDEQLLFVAGKKDQQIQLMIYQVDGVATRLHELELADADCVSSLVFNGKYLAVGLVDQIRLWTVSHQGEVEDTSLEISRTVDFGEFENVAAVDFSPNGKLLATADLGDNKLRIFDIETRELCFQRPGPHSFCSVRFSPCGSRLAMSGFDGVVHFCDAEQGNVLLALSSTKSEAGTISINSKVVFSADGSKIATNNWLGEIAVWQADDEPERKKRSEIFP